jgi:hypothetical protein
MQVTGQVTAILRCVCPSVAHTPLCCSVLQCVAVCCRVYSGPLAHLLRIPLCAVVRCSALQCVAMYPEVPLPICCAGPSGQTFWNSAPDCLCSIKCMAGVWKYLWYHMCVTWCATVRMRKYHIKRADTLSKPPACFFVAILF